MGRYTPYLCEQFNFSTLHRQQKWITYNTKVAMWQLPYDSHYKDYDEDGSKWFETSNKKGNDEITLAEKGLHKRFSEYKVKTKTIWYNDDTYEVKSKYKNNIIDESHGENHVYVSIRDDSDQLVAEKIFGFDSNDGKKIIYKNCKQGNDIFSVVQVYKFDTTKNKSTDIVNFGYTSDVSKLTNGCTFEKEYYLLNGKEVNVTKNDSGGYIVKNEDGKILTFQVE